MEELIQTIQTLTEKELQEIMRAIENRYAAAYPEWDVVYLALHKDPVKSKQELEGVLSLICGSAEFHAEQLFEKKPESF